MGKGKTYSSFTYFMQWLSLHLEMTFAALLLLTSLIGCTKATPKITALGKDAKLVDFGSLGTQSTNTLDGLESEIEIKGQCSSDVSSLWIKDPNTGKYLLSNEFTTFLSFSDTDCSDGAFKIKLSTKDGAFKYDRQQTTRFTVYLRALSKYSELTERALSYEYKKDPNDPEISFSVTNQAVDEGKYLDIELQLSKPVSAEKSVHVAIGVDGAETTVAASDYSLLDENGTTLALGQLIVFNAGEISKKIRITTNTDSEYEDQEKIKLIFSNLGGASVNFGKENSVLFVNDKSLAPTFSVSNYGSHAQATEGNKAQIQISLNKTTYKEILFKVDTSEINPPAGYNKALQSTDFTPLVEYAVRIPAGSNSVTFEIQTHLDHLWNVLPKKFLSKVTSKDASVKTVSGAGDMSGYVVISESDPNNKPNLSFKFQKADGNGGHADITELTETQADSSKGGGYYLLISMDKPSDTILNLKMNSDNSDNSTTTISSGQNQIRIGPFSKVDNSTAGFDSSIKWTLVAACLGTIGSGNGCSNLNGSLASGTNSTLTIKEDDIGSFTVSGVYSDANTNPSNYLTDATKPKISWNSAPGATNYDIEILDGNSILYKKTNYASTSIDTNSIADDNGDIMTNLGTGTQYIVNITAKNLNGGSTSALPFIFHLNRSPVAIIHSVYIQNVNSTDINFTDLITDDDGDTLTSTVTGTSNDFSSSISLGKLRLTPNSSYLGAGSIQIKFEDNKGGRTEFNLNIHSHNPLQFMGKVSNDLSTVTNYCGNIDLQYGCQYDLLSIDSNSNLILDNHCNTNNCVTFSITPDANNEFNIKSLSFLKSGEISIPANSRFIINNLLTMNNPTAKISGSGTLVVSSVTLVDGDITTDNIEFAGASTGIVSLAKGITVSNFKFNKNLKINEGSALQTITVMGLLDLCSGSLSTLSQVTFNVSGNISLNECKSADGVNTATATDLSSGVVNINGSGNQTLIGSVGSYKGKFFHLNVNKPSGALTIQNALSLHGDYIVNNGLTYYDSSTSFWFDATTGVDHRILATNHDIRNFLFSDSSNIYLQANLNATNRCLNSTSGTSLFNNQQNNSFTIQCPTDSNYDAQSALGTNILVAVPQ